MIAVMVSFRILRIGQLSFLRLLAGLVVYGVGDKMISPGLNAIAAWCKAVLA
jgi:hypothetical protein